MRWRIMTPANSEKGRTGCSKVYRPKAPLEYGEEA